jgi:hypothetical protein
VRAQVDEKRVIVFVNSKRACDIVYKQLDTLGYRCTVLHSGKTQARGAPAPARPPGRRPARRRCNSGAPCADTAYLSGCLHVLLA